MTSADLDLSEFYSNNVKAGGRCGVGEILNALPKEKAATFRKALAEDPNDLQSKAIAKTVSRWGFLIGHQTIARHRRGGCNCARS